MASYLLQVAYTPAAWSAMINKPQDRSKAVAGAVRKLGGKVEKFWMSFGEYDVVGSSTCRIASAQPRLPWQ
jgi:uncharacterized protein with GYD domain